MPTLLIVKLGAAGDVVRTTTILHLFQGWEVDWLVGQENRDLIPSPVRNVFTKVDQIPEGIVYDRLINLEDDFEITKAVSTRVSSDYVFGAMLNEQGEISYTEDSSGWFDMSLISRYGIGKADQIKLANRRSYQEIVFESLGHPFSGEEYILPVPPRESKLRGDIAVAPFAGKRWPMKNWAHFDKLVNLLSKHFTVNILPWRQSLLEHISDISNHSLVICNDSLPMHLALGLQIPTVALFTCTSPWEIYDYGLLTKLISPKLSRYFYQREYKYDAVSSISVKTTYDAVLRSLTIGIQQPLIRR